MNLSISTFSSGLKMADEVISGNIVEVVRDKLSVTALFADGEGDGIGAGVTASFVMKMATYLLKNGMSAKDVVQSIAEIYITPEKTEASVPGISVVTATTAGGISFSSLNMPKPVILKKGRLVKISCNETIWGKSKKITSDFTVRNGASLIFFNEGLLHAGETSGTCWSYSDIETYLQSAYKPLNYTAQRITELLLKAAESLEHGRPGHDISVLTLQMA